MHYIDLSVLKGCVYVGKENGIALRKWFKLDDLVINESNPLVVVFPKGARTITTSFMLGAFSGVTSTTRNIITLRKTLTFKAPYHLMDCLNLFIETVHIRKP